MLHNMTFSRKKTIWQQYGKWMIALLVLVLIGYGLVQYSWTIKQRKTLAASELYDKMIMSAKESDKTTGPALAKKIVEEYKKTPYASLAALWLAKSAVENNELALAEKHLSFAIEHAKFEAVKIIATERLARVFSAERKLTEALGLLEGIKIPEGYVPLFEETKGDIYLLQNERDKARVSYKIALKATPAQAPATRLQLKYTDVGGLLEDNQ
jgi:predicted negative regulator of RcsB-dependent stress response